MTIFAILPKLPNERLDERVAREFGADSLQVSPSHWLVSAHATAADVAKKLGILDESPTASAIVFAISSYHGRAPTPVWDWIKAKLEAKSGG